MGVSISARSEKIIRQIFLYKYEVYLECNSEEKIVKVSIVVPVYNVEKYVGKCLDSLISQTLDDYEIIVVNDGATDDSGKIIAEYQKKHPTLIKVYLKENGGLSDARNYGLQFCQGEYVGFIDSDDYVVDEMFEKMYQVAIADKSDLVVCDYYKVYGDKKERVSINRFTSNKDMLIGGLAAAWNKLYKRSIINQYNLLFPKGLIYEDTEFFCKLIPHLQRISYVPEAYVYYIQRTGSIANSQGIKTKQIFQIFRNIVDYYNENSYMSKYGNELEYFCVRIAFGSNLERVCRIEDRKLRNDLVVNTIDSISSLFPQYRNNSYLIKNINIRHLMIRMINKKNANIVVSMLHIWFKRKDRRLLG